jgi:hypothetical protein
VLPRLVLATAAVLFAAFGVAFAVAPHRLAAMVDIALPTNTATIDFVATYGGFEIGFAIFLFYCLTRPELVRTGLLASGWAVTGFAATRAAGLLVLGNAGPVMYGALAFETVCATLAFAAALLGCRGRGTDGRQVPRVEGEQFGFSNRDRIERE